MEERKHQALLNEMKGSLFEYLVASQLARACQLERQFLQTLPAQYQQVLQQQEHATRQLSPQLLPYLLQWSQQAAAELFELLKGRSPQAVRLTGQLTQATIGEADFMVELAGGEQPISLKLNKKDGAVNTKSGGIKSFFTTYFPLVNGLRWQEEFNQLVDSEFILLRHELHDMAQLTDDGNWQNWRQAALTELPGELPADMRERLHQFYARLAEALQLILQKIEASDPSCFALGLQQLAGWSVPDLWQVVCFHELAGAVPDEVDVRIHRLPDLHQRLARRSWRDGRGTASCELKLADWMLQIRIKPMNRFTTTAIKINCSLRFN